MNAGRRMQGYYGQVVRQRHTDVEAAPDAGDVARDAAVEERRRIEKGRENRPPSHWPAVAVIVAVPLLCLCVLVNTMGAKKRRHTAAELPPPLPIEKVGMLGVLIPTVAGGGEQLAPSLQQLYEQRQAPGLLNQGGSAAGRSPWHDDSIGFVCDLVEVTSPPPHLADLELSPQAGAAQPGGGRGLRDEPAGVEPKHCHFLSHMHMHMRKAYLADYPLGNFVRSRRSTCSSTPPAS